MKKILTLLLSLLLISVFATPTYANEIKVIDEPDYLTQEEEIEITNLCNEFITKTGMDCVVYIAYQFDKDVQTLADDYFDYNGYGLGDDYEGLIFCVDYGTREYTISTCGSKTIDTFTDYAQEEYMYSYIGSYLSDGDLAGACRTFVKQAYYVYSNYDYFHHNSNNNYNHDNYSPMSTSKRISSSLIIGLIGGFIVSLIYLLIKKSQLKTTGLKYEAHQYLKDTDVNYLRNGEIYLFTNTHRRRIERDNDNHSSHSSVHISSSGRSHGGTGGHKF